MASPSTRFRSGRILATNATINVDSVGFQPSRVELFNEDALTSLEWQASMPDASGKKTVSAGTITFPTAAGITPRDSGFSIGALADINDTTTEWIHWSAWE
jgi:hypothetical protein